MLQLSIITINLNNRNGLEHTIKSVYNQSFANFEYIVIDGGSNDGSIEIIEKYSDKIAYWESKEDSGIYNAMNKGIKAAKGEYCLFLNSGDALVNNEIVEKVFSQITSEAILYGNLLINETEKQFPSIIPVDYFFHNYLPHPASFIKRSLFYEISFYNEDFKLAADLEFFLKAIVIHRCIYKHLDFPITRFDGNGLSNSHFHISQNERKVINEKYYPNFIKTNKELLELRNKMKIYSRYFIFKALNRIIRTFKKNG